MKSRHLAVVGWALAGLIGVTACGDPKSLDELPTAVGVEGPTAALTEDTTWVMCPKGSGFRKCRRAFDHEVMYVDRIIVNDFADPQACQDAGQALRPVVNGGGLIISEDPNHTINTAWSEWQEDESLAWEGMTLALPNYALIGAQEDNLRHNLYHEGGHLWNHEESATPDKASAEDFANTCTKAEGRPVTSGGADQDDGSGGYCYVIDYWYADTGEHIRRDVLACFPGK